MVYLSRTTFSSSYSEGVEEAVIAVRRPEAVQEIYLAGGLLLAPGKGGQGVDVEQHRAPRREQPVELAQHGAPLLGAERAEVAHDHRDEVEAIVQLQLEVALVDVANGQPLRRGRFAGVVDGALREVDAGDVRSPAGQPGGVQPGPATEVGDLRSLAHAQVGDDPFHGAIDERPVAGGEVDHLVQVVGQHLRRGVFIGPQLVGGVELERPRSMVYRFELVEHRSTIPLRGR